ncbi:MAG: GtrA family protein [Pararhodobacter sp.]|nr:GtrA family protein [Pararhodobacter sp.]
MNQAAIPRSPAPARLRPTTLVLRYAAFAAIATLANLGAQRLVLMGGDAAGQFILAVLAGTAVGLVVKYLLDKRWIFHDPSTGWRAHGQRFSLYSVMGLVTTAIFWATETAFWLIWQTHLAREIGAVLGLTVGYLVKYQLDRRYVFTTQRGQ